MGKYTIQQIAAMLNGHPVIADAHAVIDYLLTDSRRIAFPQTSLFIALQTARNNGHAFVQEVYKSGVRNFIVKKGFAFESMPGANFLQVDDTLAALQTIAAWHRRQFSYPVIGITGSNGKTIVKEWLYQLLSQDYAIVRSPRSYNSQTGVPLSVWQMNSHHNLAIFEAGISTVKEMEKLEPVIRPGIGLLTNIGEAHREGFNDDRQKAVEKLQLFKHSKQLVFCREYLQHAGVDIEGSDSALLPPGLQLFSWTRTKDAAATLVILDESRGDAAGTTITALYKGSRFAFTIPFSDKASADNAISCCCLLLLLGYAPAVIKERMLLLQPVDMRLQLVKGINNCYVLNDAYSNDLSSLAVALDHLVQQAGHHRKTVILSDVPQSGIPDDELYAQIVAEAGMRQVTRLIGIGTAIKRIQPLAEKLAQPPVVELYDSTDDFLRRVTTHHFRDEYILLKGARVFAFERISNWLEQKVHQTVMEINLSALVHNVKQYQQQLKPGVKLMAMVKAFGYGSGSAEIANILQFHHVDYLAVAYADEGVELRKAGISLPILIMNVDEAAFEVLVQYNLEPELFSFSILQSFLHFIQLQGLEQYPVHIKIDTGMHRLGFEQADIPALGALLQQQSNLRVKSVFSHLAASEDPQEHAFTLQQASRFREACSVLEQMLGYGFIKHISNSAAIERLHDLQFDMVRLGIGMYGVDSAPEHLLDLQTVATVKTTIAQLRQVKAGETIGYNRRGRVERDSLIAVLRIGYADGFSRRLGNGVGQVFVRGRRAPVIGSVCMDMTMVDVTGCAGIKEGDIVEWFGSNITVEEVARWCGTIAYEILTGVGQRVKRIYYEE